MLSEVKLSIHNNYKIKRYCKTGLHTAAYMHTSYIQDSESQNKENKSGLAVSSTNHHHQYQIIKNRMQIYRFIHFRTKCSMYYISLHFA